MKLLYWAGNIGNKFGSYEKYILRLAEKCRKKSIKLSVIHECDNFVSEYRAGLQREEAKYILAPNTINNPYKNLGLIYQLIKEAEPDALLVNFANPLIAIIGKIARTPVVYKVCHTGLGYKITIRTHFTRRLLNYFVNRYIAVSNRVKDEEIAVGADPKKVFLNYLGLPFTELDKNPILISPAPYSNDDEIKKIITIGRFSEEKGMKFVTELAVEILRNRENIVWWLVGGDGSDLKYCQDLITFNKIEKKIFILNQRNDVPALLSRSYLQVIGSKFEGLPLGVLEASYYKVPTVGPRIRGVDEAVVNYYSGILVCENQQTEFINAINLFLNNQEMKEKMGERAKQYVLTKFDSNKAISQLLNFIVSDLLKIK